MVGPLLAVRARGLVGEMLVNALGVIDMAAAEICEIFGQLAEADGAVWKLVECTSRSDVLAGRIIFVRTVARP